MSLQDIIVTADSMAMLIGKMKYALAKETTGPGRTWYIPFIISTIMSLQHLSLPRLGGNENEEWTYIHSDGGWSHHRGKSLVTTPAEL